jgi:hypothetical protein
LDWRQSSASSRGTRGPTCWRGLSLETGVLAAPIPTTSPTGLAVVPRLARSDRIPPRKMAWRGEEIASNRRRLSPNSAWPFQLKGAKRAIDVPIRPRLSVSTAETAVWAAVQGVGATRVLHYQVRRRSDTGHRLPEACAMFETHKSRAMPRPRIAQIAKRFGVPPAAAGSRRAGGSPSAYSGG